MRKRPVKSATRKARDLTIVTRLWSGKTPPEVAEEFDLTYQRIMQIWRAGVRVGADKPWQVKAEPKPRRRLKRYPAAYQPGTTTFFRG